MAITFTQKSKIQQYLAIAIGALFLITAIIIWQGFLGGGTGGISEISFPPTRTVEIDLEVLDSPLFLEIQEASSEVTIPENIGRDNPFEL